MTNDIHVTCEPAILVERVKRSLKQFGYPEMEHIQCHAQESNVQLDGCLTSYYLKQVAQSIALKVSGVHQVINHIEVIFPTTESEFRQR